MRVFLLSDLTIARMRVNERIKTAGVHRRELITIQNPPIQLDVYCANSGLRCFRRG